MTTIQVSDALREWLARNGIGNEASAGKRAQPRRPIDGEGGSHRPMGNLVKGPGAEAPGKFTGRSVNNRQDEGLDGPFPEFVADAVTAMATRNGTRVVRCVPFLAVIEGGKERHG